MTSDDFFTVVKLAGANSDQYSPDYAFLVNVVAVSKNGRHSHLFGSLPSQADATTILTAARGDALGRTMFRTTQVKPVIKTSSGNVQRQYKDAPMSMFKINVDPTSATVYFDAKRQNATIANYKKLYAVLGIVLPEDSALDSIVVNPVGDASYFLEQVLRAVVTDLSLPGVTLPVESASGLTKQLTPVGTLATLTPSDVAVVDIPQVTSIDYFPALVFSTRHVVTVTFSRPGSTPIDLPAGFPLVAKADTATELSAVEFVDQYYPPPNLATIPSPIPKGTLRLTNARMPVVLPPSTDVLQNPLYQTARENLRSHAQTTNTVRRDLLSLVADASVPLPSTWRPIPGAPPPPPPPAGGLPPPPPPPPPRTGATPDAFLEYLRRADDQLTQYLNTTNGLNVLTAEDTAERDRLVADIARLKTTLAAFRANPPITDSVMQDTQTQIASEMTVLRQGLDALIARLAPPVVPGPTGAALPPPVVAIVPGPTAAAPPPPVVVPGPTAAAPPPPIVAGPTGAAPPPLVVVPGPTGAAPIPVVAVVSGPTAAAPPPPLPGPTGAAPLPPIAEEEEGTPPPQTPMRSTIIEIPFFEAIKVIVDQNAAVAPQSQRVLNELEPWIRSHQEESSIPYIGNTWREILVPEELSFINDVLHAMIRANPAAADTIRVAVPSIQNPVVRTFMNELLDEWRPAGEEEEPVPRSPSGLPLPTPPPVPPGIGINDLLSQMKAFIQSVPELQIPDVRFDYDPDDRLSARIRSALDKLRPSDTYALSLPARAASSTSTAVKYTVQTPRPRVQFAIVNWKATSSGRTSWSVSIASTNVQSGGARKKPSNVTIQFYIVPTSRPVQAFQQPAVTTTPPAAAVPPPVRALSPAQRRAAIPILPQEEAVVLPGTPLDAPLPAAPTPSSPAPKLPPPRSRFPSEEEPEPTPPPAMPIETPPAMPVETPPAVPIETPPAVPIETPPAMPVETPPAMPVETPPAVPVETPPVVVPSPVQLPPGFQPTPVRNIAIETTSLPKDDTPPQTITIYTTFPDTPAKRYTLTYAASKGEVMKQKKVVNHRGEVEFAPVNGFVYESSDFGSYVLYNPVYKTVVFLGLRGGRRRTLKRGGRRSRTAKYTPRRQR